MNLKNASYIGAISLFYQIYVAVEGKWIHVPVVLKACEIFTLRREPLACTSPSSSMLEEAMTDLHYWVEIPNMFHHRPRSRSEQILRSSSDPMLHGRQ